MIRISSEQTSVFEAGEIPARNLALLTTATLLTQGPRVVALGIHAGTGYFDCSPIFLAQADRLLAECTGGAASLVAPFLHWTKQDVVTYAQSEGLDLALTYSCERGTAPPCGTCLSCKDRGALRC
jgi:7-cyano-7-deazaguanine synthase